MTIHFVANTELTEQPKSAEDVVRVIERACTGTLACNAQIDIDFIHCLNVFARKHVMETDALYDTLIPFEVFIKACIEIPEIEKYRMCKDELAFRYGNLKVKTTDDYERITVPYGDSSIDFVTGRLVGGSELILLYFRDAYVYNTI